MLSAQTNLAMPEELLIMTPQQTELFAQKVSALSKHTGLSKAKVSECLIHQLELMTCEWNLASTGRSLREVIEASRQDRKNAALKVGELALKSENLRQRLQISNDVAASLAISLREHLGIVPVLPELMTDADLVEMGVPYIDSVGRIISGKRQPGTPNSQADHAGIVTPGGSTPLPVWRSKHSVIPETARPNLDVSEITTFAQEVGRKLWDENYSVTVENVQDLDPKIIGSDCDAVNSVFSKRKYQTQRRVWEVFLNRLRRLARHFGDQEEATLVMDFMTEREDIAQLWERFAEGSESRWRPHRSMPWHFLIQFPYRKDLQISDPLLVLQVGYQLFSKLTIGVAPSTGYRTVINSADNQTANRMVGELIAGVSKWFNPIYLLVDSGAVRIKSSLNPSIPSPLEAKRQRTEMPIDRDKVVEAMRKAVPDIGPDPELRLFRFKRNAKNFSDGNFIPWPQGVEQKTRSGVIVVGHQDVLFQVNLYDWSVQVASLLDQDTASGMVVAHYRNLRAIYEPRVTTNS